jgi:hypothetical protein
VCGGAIRVRICTPDISGGVPGEKCPSRHVQVCYGIPRRQILHCEDRYVSLYMSVDYFEDQRREMVTAIRAIADHVAAQISKSALDKRVLEAMAKVPRHEFVPVGLPDAQQLVVAEKDLNGRVTTKEFMQVRFSLLEGAEELRSASLKQ